MNHFIYLSTSLILISFFSWAQNTKTEHSYEHEQDSKSTALGESHEHHEKEGLHLTTKQIEAIGLKFGDFSQLKINDFVKVTGTLGLPPNGHATLSAKSGGTISGTKRYVEGDFIKQGEIIGYVNNLDFIIKQQDYLETKALLKFKTLELARQKKLISTGAGVPRTLQNATSEVAVLEAKCKGLAKQLSYLNIATDNLTPNTIKQNIPILAPMSGYVVSVNLHDGLYVQPDVSLMQIISDEHLHLELNVFEQDIAKVKIGQTISYTLPIVNSTVYEGEVSVIAKEFDSELKTVKVHGHLKGEKPYFLKDLFIHAKIWLNGDTVMALPTSSVIREAKESFIYVSNVTPNHDEVEFIKVLIIPGAADDGYIAIKLLDNILKGMKVVTEGAYYLYAQSKAGELKHEH